MQRTLVLISMLLATVNVQPVAQSKRATGEVEVISAQFVVSGGYINVPKNFFVLVRKGGNFGAIRFTDVQEDGQGLGKSEYESYFQRDGSTRFQHPNLIRRKGEIEIKPMRGVHALAWQPGKNKLRVGKWWFGCLGPTLINMSSHFSEKDQGYEFAPTSARDVAEIDASDKRLQWFRFDPNARVAIPVSRLSK